MITYLGYESFNPKVDIWNSWGELCPWRCLHPPACCEKTLGWVNWTQVSSPHTSKGRWDVCSLLCISQATGSEICLPKSPIPVLHRASDFRKIFWLPDTRSVLQTFFPDWDNSSTESSSLAFWGILNFIFPPSTSASHHGKLKQLSIWVLVASIVYPALLLLLCLTEEITCYDKSITTCW